MLGACLMALLLNSCKSSDIILADAYIDGPLTIVVCEEEQFIPLAEDFAMHLRLITGAKIPVNPEDKPIGSYIIRITQLAEGVKEDDLVPEEARWHFGKTEAVFYGQGPLGPSHAGYMFLEEVLGFRWPTPNDIYIPPRQIIIPIFHTDGDWNPRLATRLIRPANGQKTNPAMRLWYKRMRTGEHDTPPFDLAFTDWWKKYGKEHPDYFALVDGKREPVKPSVDDDEENNEEAIAQAEAQISICPSNHAVAKQIIDNWDKKSPYINLCENAAPAEYACHCENCRAMDSHQSEKLDDKIGADRYVFLANEVLQMAKEYKEDVRIIMNSANATLEPSLNIKIPPSIILGLSPKDFTMTFIEKYLKGWHNAGMIDFIYHPQSHVYFAPNGYPIGYARHFFKIFQTMFHNGAMYFDYEASDEFTDIFRFHNDYILMHAMNNPDVPFERWDREFAMAYVGDAFMDLQKYFHHWEHLWDSKSIIEITSNTDNDTPSYFTRQFSRQINHYYNDNDFAAAGMHLTTALNHTSLTTEQIRRLNDLKQFNDHAALLCKAVATGNPWHIRALREYRRDHNMPAIMPYEIAIGDFSGVSTMKELNFQHPLVQLPLFWHFRLDPDNTGEASNYQNNMDFSFWDGMMPTDSSWKHPSENYSHPTKVLRMKASTYNGVAWYACETEIPQTWKENRRIFIHFNEVYGDAVVWFNGKKVGSHKFAHNNGSIVSFDFEITDEIDWSRKKQLVAVKVVCGEGDGGIRKSCFIGSISKKQ